jgi:acyl carrier protein
MLARRKLKVIFLFIISVHDEHAYEEYTRRSLPMEPNKQDAPIMDRMTKIIGEVLKPGATVLTPDKRFREDLGADSLDIAALLMALEEEFKTQISDEEAARLTTIGSVVDFVKTKLPAGAA